MTSLARRTARELLRRRRAVTVLLGWSLVATLPALASGRLVALAVDRGFLRDRLWTGLAWLAVLGAAMAAGAVGARRMPPALGRVVEPIRDQLIVHVVTSTLRGRTGEGPDRLEPGVVARICEHADAVRDNAAGLLQGVQQLALTVLAATVGVLLLAPAAAALVVPPILVSLVLLMRLLPSLVERRRALLLAQERVAASMSRIIEARRDVVTCGAQSQAVDAASRDIDRQIAAERAVARAGALRTGLALAGGHLSLLGMLLAAPWMVRHGHLSPGEVLGALTYITANLQPALRSAVQIGGGSGVEIAVTLRRLEEATPTVVPAPRGTLRPSDRHLCLRDVTFSYGTAEPVVRDLSLTIPPDSHLAIVGPSGTGKSTLANLLCGLARPQRGEISIGGVPLPLVDPAWLRRTIAIVPQETYVFAGTLLENLTYLNPAATRAEIDTAVAVMGLTPLVDRLGGLASRVDPGLTPGERQLITLARVWLSPATIVVLDEATCHLDPGAEARAERAFRARPGTLIVIAHRLTSARRATRILVMDGPRTELGDHAELLCRSALYTELTGAWQAADLS